jgi:hypothetical protein
VSSMTILSGDPENRRTLHQTILHALCYFLPYRPQG